MEEKKASLWSVVNILNEAGARQQHFVALGTERGLNKNYHYSEPRSRHTTVCYSAQQRFTLAAVRAGRCWMDREIFFKGRTDVKASPRTRGKKKKKKRTQHHVSTLDPGLEKCLPVKWRWSSLVPAGQVDAVCLFLSVIWWMCSFAAAARDALTHRTWILFQLLFFQVMELFYFIFLMILLCKFKCNAISCRVTVFLGPSSGSWINNQHCAVCETWQSQNSVMGMSGSGNQEDDSLPWKPLLENTGDANDIPLSVQSCVKSGGRFVSHLHLFLRWAQQSAANEVFMFSVSSASGGWRGFS